MKIVHLPSDFFPAVGGTERYVETLAAELAPLGCDSIVARHGGEPANHQIGKVVIPVESFRALAPTTDEIYSNTAGYDLRDFEEFLNREEPDVLHFHAFTCGAGLSHAQKAIARGIPYVITYHTPAMSCARGALLLNNLEVCDGRIDAERCSKCTLIDRAPIRKIIDHLPSYRTSHRLEKMYASWKEFFGNASAIVATADWVRSVLDINGIDPTKIMVLRQALPGEDRQRSVIFPEKMVGELKIGYFGRINFPQKGAGVLFDAGKILKAKGIPFHLEWVGPVKKENLRMFQSRLKALGPATSHLGLLSGSKLREWIRSRDVIVVPSLWLETGPLTVVEAWDEGVPVVGTDLGGIQEWFTGTTMKDLLFKWKQPEDLARILMQLKDGKPRTETVTIPGMAGVARKMLLLYETVTHSRSIKLRVP